MMQQYSSMEFLYLNGNEPSAEVVNSEIYIPFDNMVTGPGNESVFQQVMQSLAQNCTYRDVIVLFISSHGDHDVNGPFISLPNGDRIYANELKQLLDNILCEKRIIIINSCFSGDFICYLQDYKNIIITSAGHESSAMADNQFPDHNDSLENECYDNYFTQSKEYSFHDEFTYHLLNAMLQPAYTKLLMIERITGTDGFASLESFKINRAGNSLVLIHLIL